MSDVDNMQIEYAPNTRSKAFDEENRICENKILIFKLQ